MALKKPTRLELQADLKTGLMQQLLSAVMHLPVLMSAATAWLQADTKSSTDALEAVKDSDAVKAAREKMLLARLEAETEEHKLRASKYSIEREYLESPPPPTKPAVLVSRPAVPVAPRPPQPHKHQHKGQPRQQPPPRQPYNGQTEGYIPPPAPPLGNTIKGLDKVVAAVEGEKKEPAPA